MLVKALLNMLSPAGSNARLTVLIFHRVLSVPDSLFPDAMHAGRFDDLCKWIAEWFNVMPLDDAARKLTEMTLPARAACITFDDGYADNHDVALPILQRHGLTATFFVATGFLDGGRMWNDTIIEAVRRCTLPNLDLTGTAADILSVLPLVNLDDRRDAIGRILGATKYLPPSERRLWVNAVAERADVKLPNDLMMRSDQVRALHRAGMGVGGHTVNHPILARLGTTEMRFEISEGRRHLQELTQARVSLFAYPNGKKDIDYDERCVQVVQEQGFSAAVSTTWGVAHRRSDLLQLPRFTPWDKTRTRFGLRLARQMFISS